MYHLFRDTNKDNISCAQSSSKNTLHGSTFLECCECCKLGKTAAKENKSCGHDDLPFNGTCGGIYQRCCVMAKRGKIFVSSWSQSIN